jgi:hypothetical protein
MSETTKLSEKQWIWDGPTQPRKDRIGRNSSGSGSINRNYRPYGSVALTRDTLYSQKSVSGARLRTTSHGVLLLLM